MKMKRNLIKGSAGNVSTTIKIRRINCFFLRSKRRAGGGEAVLSEGTKYSRGRGRWEGKAHGVGGGKARDSLDKIRK